MAEFPSGTTPTSGRSPDDVGATQGPGIKGEKRAHRTAIDHEVAGVRRKSLEARESPQVIHFHPRPRLKVAPGQNPAVTQAGQHALGIEAAKPQQAAKNDPNKLAIDSMNEYVQQLKTKEQNKSKEMALKGHTVADLMQKWESGLITVLENTSQPYSGIPQDWGHLYSNLVHPDSRHMADQVSKIVGQVPSADVPKVAQAIVKIIELLEIRERRTNMELTLERYAKADDKQRTGIFRGLESMFRRDLHRISKNP